MKKILEIIIAFNMSCLFVVIIIRVVFRILLKIPISWTENIPVYSYIFIVFLGSAMVMMDETHTSITLLLDIMSPKMQSLIRIIGRFIMVPFLAIFTYSAYTNALFNWTTALPVTPWIKVGHMYFVLFISGTIMIFYTLMNIYYDIFGQPNQNIKSGGVI